MPLSNYSAEDIVEALLEGLDPSWRAGATIYLRAHTASPGAAGTAVTNECTYGSYNGVAITKSSGWSNTVNVSTNANLLQFPVSTSGTNTITHLSLCTTQNGAGEILVYGALSSSQTVNVGGQPQVAAGALTVTVSVS